MLLKDPHNECLALLLESCQKVCAHAISNMAHDIKYDFLHAWILNPLLPSLNI